MSVLDPINLANWMQKAKRAASTNDYPELARCLRRIRKLPLDDAPDLTEMFPLAERLGHCPSFLDSQDNTGPEEALKFFRHLVEKLPESATRQQALEGFGRVMDGFVEMAPLLAAEEMVRVIICDTTKGIKNITAGAVDNLLKNTKFQESGRVGLRAKLSWALFQNGYEDKAAHLAQSWRMAMNALPLEEAIVKVMEAGPRMDCGSPLETEVADFVFKNHKKIVMMSTQTAREVLEYLELFSKPGGACSTQARNKLKTLREEVGECGRIVRVRHSGKGFDRYEI